MNSGETAATQAGSDNEMPFPSLQAAPAKSIDAMINLAFRATLFLLTFGALLLRFPVTIPAQSLGEVARRYRKELEERKKMGEVPVKVFTNDDIARMPPVSIVGPSEGRPPEPDTKQTTTTQPLGTTVRQATSAPTLAQHGKTEESAKSKEYWQAKFKAARAALEQAKEEQTLVEDEIQLLQIQQARELNPDRSRKLNSKIDASTIELEAKRATTHKAQAALDEIEKEFKKSGAPESWIQDDSKRD